MRPALVTSGAITQRLHRLVERGLTTRAGSGPDGRAVRVTRPAAHLGERAQRPSCRRHGLDVPSFDVLAALHRAGPPYQLTPTALMRTALVTSGAITQRLDRLEERGLITRERSEADGRAVVVTLTEAGRAALDATLPDHLETERRLLAGLSGDDLDALAGLLRRLLIALGRVPG